MDAQESGIMDHRFYIFQRLWDKPFFAVLRMDISIVAFRFAIHDFLFVDKLQPFLCGHGDDVRKVGGSILVEDVLQLLIAVTLFYFINGTMYCFDQIR